MEDQANKYVVKEFPSLNGLGRPAMMFGVPLMVGLIILAIAIALSFIAQIKYGMMGFLTMLFFIPVILVIRQMTATDDHALKILYFEMKFWLKRLFAGKKVYEGKFYIVSSNNLKHDVAYFRKFTDVQATKRKVKEFKD